MLVAQLEQELRDIIGASTGQDGDDSIRFAVEFSLLLAKVLPEEVSAQMRQAMGAALKIRTDLTEGQISTLLDLALAPAARSQVETGTIRAFEGRFGPAEANALRIAVKEEMSLAGFAEKYGPAEALLLLDSLFNLCAVDGIIDKNEIGRLQSSATELGIDQMLVSALFRKYDNRHATGDFSFALDKPALLIGRSKIADIGLPDPQVGHRHAEIVRSDSGWRIVDQSSGRPTVLNGKLISSAPFRHGDSLRVGPYTLVLNKDETSLTAYGMASFSALSMRSLNRKIGDITLLEDVNFTVFSGEVIALVGPSGAGKTTLLNAIAGIAPADNGQVILDGQSFHSLLSNDRSLVGIVPQDDVVHAELTVAESLEYSALLRFPSDVESNSINERVSHVLKELGIKHIQDSRIGDAVRRGISGGQRKRVNLGQELLTQSTRVLFLDEPTSGLDPQTAQDIVSLVRQLADDGRIVFLVTHDVTPSVLSMVDHLLVLAPGGRLAWFGPPNEANTYFNVNSADEIFAALPDATPQQWSQRYRASSYFKKFVRTREHLLGLDALDVEATENATIYRTSSFKQYTTLTKRYAKVKMRDTWGTAILIAQAPILAAAIIIVFPDPDTAMMFMLALSAFWFGASGSVRELISERTLWRREARVGLGVLPYMASKVTILGALVAFQCSILAGLSWYFLGLGGEFGYSLTNLTGVTILTGLVGMTLGLMISSLFQSGVAAVGSLPLWLIPQITFGGLIVRIKDMEPGSLADWLSKLMVTRYSFEGLIKTGEQLSIPGTKGLGAHIQNISGPLYDLGFRTSDVDDMGIPLPDIVAILTGFFFLFLIISTVKTSSEGRSF